MVTVPPLPAGPMEVASLLPGAIFLLPILSGVLIFAVRGRTPRAAQGLALATVGLMAVLACWIVALVVRGEVLTAWNNELRVDALSALLVLVVAVIGLAATGTGALPEGDATADRGGGQDTGRGEPVRPRLGQEFERDIEDRVFHRKVMQFLLHGTFQG